MYDDDTKCPKHHPIKVDFQKCHVFKQGISVFGKSAVNKLKMYQKLSIYNESGLVASSSLCYIYRQWISNDQDYLDVYCFWFPRFFALLFILF